MNSLVWQFFSIQGPRLMDLLTHSIWLLRQGGVIIILGSQKKEHVQGRVLQASLGSDALHVCSHSIGSVI